jgi:hypothetical protein
LSPPSKARKEKKRKKNSCSFADEYEGRKEAVGDEMKSLLVGLQLPGFSVDVLQLGSCYSSVISFILSLILVMDFCSKFDFIAHRIMGLHCSFVYRQS